MKTTNMKTEIFYNSDMHFEHRQWNQELSFWKDELQSFNHRLEELVNRWTDKNMLAQLEHYQNEFILHEETIDVLLHDINVHERNMAAHYKKGEDVLNKDLVKNHVRFRTRMETQRHIYSELKKAFYRFLSKYM